MLVGFKKKNNFFYASLFLVYLIIHLTTLSHFPLPWFDEVFFASITESFSQSGTFYPNVSFFAFKNREVITYGPIYFLLNNLFIELFGINTFSFRIVNFVCGVLCIWISLKILKLKDSSHSSWLFIFIFLLDPFFNIGLHEGRMDLVALLFSLLSILFLFKSQKNIGFIGLSSISIAFAALTTPRSAIIIIPSIIIGFFVIQNHKKSTNKLLFLISWITPLIIIYGSWLLYAFGSIENYLAYYIERNQGNSTAVHGYLGNNFYIPKHEFLLIGCVIILIVCRLLNYFKEKFSLLTFYSLFSIVLFYFLVVDWGSYSVFILPFYYLLLFTPSQIQWTKTIQKFLILLVFGFNSIFFLIKTAYIYTDFSQRNPQKIAQFIQKYIPSESRVIGEAIHYYACKQNNIEYRLFDKYLTLEEREKKLRTEFNYDYFIVSRISTKRAKDELEYFFSKNDFIEIAAYKSEPSYINKLLLSTKLISDMEKYGYSCTIYKRVSKNKKI